MSSADKRLRTKLKVWAVRSVAEVSTIEFLLFQRCFWISGPTCSGAELIPIQPAGRTKSFDATSNSSSPSSAQNRKACQVASFPKSFPNAVSYRHKFEICLNFRVPSESFPRLFVDRCA